MLAGLCRGGDADDLARTALEDQEVTNADVVAWDSDGVGGTSIAGWAVWALVRSWGRHGDFAVLDNNVFLTLNYFVLVGVVAVVVAVAFEWVKNAVGSAVETVTERVVLALFVVISHVKAVATSFARAVEDTFLDLDLFVEANRLTLAVSFTCYVSRVGALLLPTTRSSVLLGEWGGAVTKVPLGKIDWVVVVDLCTWSVTGWVLAVVDAVLNFDLSVGVTLVWLVVALAVNVNLYASVDVLLVAADALVAVFNANVFTSVSSSCGAVAVFFGDADVFAVAVVSTGRALLLLSIAVLSVFPSSALNSYTLVSLDFSGLGSLLVPVG